MAPLEAFDDQQLRSLTSQSMAVDTKEPMGVYAFRIDEPGAALALSVEQRVFDEAFGNSPEVLGQEYAPYDEASVFLCVVDHRRQVPAGMMRIIVPSDAGLKSLNDVASVWGTPYPELFERSSLDYRAEATWDIATLAVAPDYRGVAQSGLVSIALYQTLSMVAQRCGVNELVAILHEPVFMLLQRRFHTPFSVIGDVEAREYLDSPASLPVLCDLAAWHTHLEEVDPILHEIMHDGEGMEPAIRPPSWEDVAAMFETVQGLGDVVKMLTDPRP